MEIRTTQDAKTTALDFTNKLLNLMLEKKRIDADIKELKNDYKEEGVPVAVVSKIINMIKADKSKTDAQRFELETLYTWADEDKEINDKIGMLVEK